MWRTRAGLLSDIKSTKTRGNKKATASTYWIHKAISNYFDSSNRTHIHHKRTGDDEELNKKQHKTNLNKLLKNFPLQQKKMQFVCAMMMIASARDDEQSRKSDDDESDLPIRKQSNWKTGWLAIWWSRPKQKWTHKWTMVEGKQIDRLVMMEMIEHTYTIDTSNWSKLDKQ